ncbi:DEAD/DEAH box helicase [Roseospira navarrensis]|uniref:Serine/threonine protein phosphatase n=1 Tax=Roseospira navarrensis TaxID=140058 RepID=A0A7X1ZF78_9PROT|nr:DEAD/DEAH box helicase [Roseospira navarrensis]MQX37188.1 serine/threonine protein phosphatase [Roseospira navarrensis]
MVAGSRPQPYRTEARFGLDRHGMVTVTTECSCPVGLKCKHGVALLLQARDEDALRLPDGDGPSRPRTPVPARSPDPAGDDPAALPAAVHDWLRALESAGASDSEEYPESVRHRLIYALSLHVWPMGRREAQVRLLSVRLLKDGSLSDVSNAYDPTNVHGSKGGAKFLRPSDRRILDRLVRHTGYGGSASRSLTGEEGAALIEAMLETGRVRWEAVAGPVVVRGEPRPGRVTWAVEDDGRQRPAVDPVTADTTAPALAVLPVAPPWAIFADPDDSDRVVACPLTLPLAPRSLGALLKAPALSPDQIAPVRDRLASVLGAGVTEAAPDVLPRPLPPPRIIDEAPVPCLRIFGRDMRRDPYWMRFRGAQERETLRLVRPWFRYAGHDITPTTVEATVTRRDGDGLARIVRSRTREREALRTLSALGFTRAAARKDVLVPPEHREDLTLIPEEDLDTAWLRVLLDDVPRLRETGWMVEVAEDFPLRPVMIDGDFEAGLTEAGEGSGPGSGMDWFDLSLGVVVDGERVDLLPALLDMLNGIPAEILEDLLEDADTDGTSSTFRIPDGRFLQVPFDRLRPILRALVDLLGTDTHPAEGARLSALDMADLTAFEDAVSEGGVAFRGGDQVRALGRRLREAHGTPPPVTLPSVFTGTLRPYQAAGVAWMQMLREVGLGGILADDMGLGKTVQALAHLSVEKAEGRLDRPSLVIAPTSLMGNWRAEAAQFAPHLKTLVLQGPDRKADFGRLAEHDLVFSTYPLLSHDAEVLAGQDWHLLILDEAQTVKNPRTTAAKTLRRLTARHRLALTGTPVENNLGELWALYDAVAPGLLGDRKTFTKQWRTPIEKHGDADRQARLSRRLRPFLLRRTKGDVLADLPPRTDIVEHVTLEAGQRAVYEAIRLAMHGKVREAIARKGLARSRIELLEALLRLRQVCCDPRLVAGARQAARAGRGRVAAAGSAKLDRLMEMLPELVAEGRRVLLFSQFTSMLDLIEAAVTRAGLPYVMLTGKTRDRTAVVQRFQTGDMPLFLISLKAGGTGLNLTAADTVIHYDPWWNPAVEQQATDRAHRIGQDKAVFVHRLIAEDSIEVKMQTLKDRKQALADGLYDPDGATPFDISEDDVEFLLGDA